MPIPAALATPPLNTSGIVPLDLRILVKPDPVEERTAGGIILADLTKDKEKYAAVKATLIAVGDNAFKEWGEHSRRPVPGERVCYAQYSGSRIKGADGDEYVIMNDADVTGLVEVRDV